LLSIGREIVYLTHVMLIILNEVVPFDNDYKPKNILVTRIQAKEYLRFACSRADSYYL